MDRQDSRPSKGAVILALFNLLKARTMRLQWPLLWLCVTAASALLIVCAGAQPRGARIALVIGNAAYTNAGTPLPTTIGDARSLAEELRRNNFDVDVRENIGKEEMRRAIDGFIGKIRNDVVALFYLRRLWHPGRAGDLSVPCQRTGLERSGCAKGRLQHRCAANRDGPEGR